MADKEKNWLDKILEIIKLVIGFFKGSKLESEADDLYKELSSVHGDDLRVKDVLRGVSDEAKDVIIEEGKTLLLNHGKVLLGLSEAQKEYAVHIAYLRAVKNLDSLSIEELIEYNKLISKTAELAPAVAKELASFWNAFGEAVSTIFSKVTDIGIKAAAVGLKTVIPIL